ncbi:MAG: tryptophan--tRNA ligase, partial [Tissierellia bacterium]|nr:tryptophan--tRNA ligase [Tissierellia bacterium]
DIPYLEKVAREGAEKASKIASKTIDKVYRKVGFR